MEKWKEYKATEFCQTVTDGTHDSPKPKDKGHYLITSKHLKDNGIDFNSANYISEEDYIKIIARSKVEQYDILFSMIGTIGNIVQVKAEDVDFAVKNIGIFKMGKNRLKSSWLLYWLKSPCAHEYVSQRLAGSTQSYLTLSSLRKFPVLYPGDSKANKIVTILKSLDDKIAVNKQINDNLEQQAQALFKSWFVDFEPFRDQPFMESELGMIPEGWRVGTLGDYCKVFTGKKDVKQSLSKGLYPFFSCSPNHSYSNEYIYDGASIIIAGNGSYTGRTSFYFGKYDLYQRTYACTIKEGINEKRISFLYYMMKCLFEPVKMGGTRGSSIPYIVMNDIVLQKFVLEDSLVGKYSDFAYSIMKQIQKNNQESRRLAKLRDTLLPRLMSGELKVNEIENAI